MTLKGQNNTFTIFVRLISQKYNLLLSCFCKIEISMKFAINAKYYTYRHSNRTLIVLRKKSVARTREKKKEKKKHKKSGALKYRALASGFPE